ncbi:ABC transporter ATP-binding protein [Sediminispirochaeta smaragdinae]|uniref:ABC transporter related protein n=1 Tax=Sediminispirochaeta smaragdinae (strain DSM 11293 / JCM 15392 / SEBR 4228) TaxID=573413 RepID=E1R2K5_SEDSS|nr:ABC transporter ATP-binding protein [Sediminispirochaeta smaragdinae]ADK82565.1 ABC transporter related protein [Sediminispirochaeta smaragdinae DSM 11293]
MNSFKRILKFMRPYLPFAILGPLLMLLEVAMDLIQPRLMEKIVDIGLANFDYHYILKTGLMMAAAAVVGVLGGAGCSFFSTLAGVGMGTDLRSRLYSHIQRLSTSDIDRLSTGSLVTRLTNDIIQIQEISIMMLRILVRAPLQIIGSLIMAILISPRLSLILVLLIPLLLLSITIIMRRSFPLFTQVQERIDGINTVTQEALSGVRVIKAFAREEFETERFAKANGTLVKTMEKAATMIAWIHPVMILLLNGGIALALYFGGTLNTQGPLTTGELMAFLNYLMQLLMSLMMVSMVLIRFSRGEASAKRIMEVFDTHPNLRNPAEPKHLSDPQGEILFDKVSFNYGKNEEERDILDSISFTLQAGRTTGIIGTTGSGKSTLVHLLTRLYDVASGRILLDGVDIRELNQEDLRTLITVVPQQAMLFSGTIRENITFGKPEATDSQILEAAEVAQIRDFIDKNAEGLDTVLQQRGVNLSGGQKQRLCIARALLPSPPVLILDDSTSALDAKTAYRLQQALCEKRSRMTTIIIAQRIASIREADSIIVLDDGAVVDMAPHEVLLQRCGLYRDIVRSQEGEGVLHV